MSGEQSPSGEIYEQRDERILSLDGPELTARDDSQDRDTICPSTAMEPADQDEVAEAETLGFEDLPDVPDSEEEEAEVVDLGAEVRQKYVKPGGIVSVFKNAVHFVPFYGIGRRAHDSLRCRKNANAHRIGQMLKTILRSCARSARRMNVQS